MFHTFAVNRDIYYTVLQYYYAHYKIFVSNELFFVAEIPREHHIL